MKPYTYAGSAAEKSVVNVSTPISGFALNA
jgi:hypothetical protein